MTFSTLASPGVSLQGGGGSSGGGGGTPGGSNTQIQYNSSGTFAGASGLTTNGTELTIASGTKTADAPVLNMSQTWNNAAVTFTGLKFNVVSDTSAASSLLMDLQVGGASRFKLTKGGMIDWTGGGSIGAYPAGGSKLSADTASNGLAFYSGSTCLAGVYSPIPGFYIGSAASGVYSVLTAKAAANLRLGAADTTGTTAPTPQFLSAQSWASSTTNNQTGANFTIDGSQGTGTGAGGSIIFRVAPAGGTSNGVQNGLSTFLEATSSRLFNVYGAFTDASNYERLTLNFTASNDYSISTNKAGTGSNRSLTIETYGNATATFESETLKLPNNGRFAFSSTSASRGTVDLILARDAANTLALRNGNEGQTFRLYGRFTDITNNFERFFINAPTTSGNAVQLGTQKGATTGAARALEFQTDGATRLTMPSNGGVWTTGGEFFHFRAGATASASVISPSDGVMTLGNWGANDFNRLQFGGTSSAFPALKRVSANLQVIAADGTSSAGMIVGNQALATTATDGFLYVPTCAGTPTGTPTAQTGTAPIVINTTNNKLYFYSDGQWRDAGP